MLSSDSKKRFLELVQEKGYKLSSLYPKDGIELMLVFYKDNRADGCEFDHDGDMLLYQWGCYDWGEGESFQLNITRQLIEATADDDEIRQLSLTFKYTPNETLRKLGNGNKWCNSSDDIAEFRPFIESSPAFIAIAKAQSPDVTLELGITG